ncbi:hypothetical protein [uncultured Prevotella sp.]|jgi:hypothetical protein|uniref:hypothetical protein n=1 Tax=uncultured Prevotella sp. TaxID=159272 RepID=UPI002590CF01|nr:hypothetical protein [uncultured Prevotella sp.]
MIKKNYGRKVFLIEVSLNNKVLGYYAGKDRDYRIIVKGIDDAMMFKNEKSVRHNVAHQERYNNGGFVFRAIEAEETKTKIYYDEYDNVEQMNALYTIRIKVKSDMLLEPGYLSEYDKNDNSFKSSLNFEKAILFGEYRINKMLYHLSRKYAEKYVFFFDRLFVVENRDIKIIGNIN